MNHAQILSLLINGVLREDERVKVLHWCDKFNKKCHEKGADCFIDSTIYRKCSVCAFINRCGVIGHEVGEKVIELESFLKQVGVHMPVTWTVVCIIGGVLMDMYSSNTHEKVDDCYLLPIDIITHYMISRNCPDNDDRPMVALSNGFSLLTKNKQTNTENDVLSDANETPDSEEPVKKKRKKDVDSQCPHTHTQQVVNRLLGMFTACCPSDHTKCKNMAYIQVDKREETAVMRIPNSVMIEGSICQATDEAYTGGAMAAAVCDPTQKDKYNHLYGIYKQLVQPASVQKNEVIFSRAEKASTFKKETYNWMKLLDMQCSHSN